MSVQDLPPLKVVHVDDGALSYLIKPEGSSGLGLRLIINPDGSNASLTPRPKNIRILS